MPSTLNTTFATSLYLFCLLVSPPLASAQQINDAIETDHAVELLNHLRWSEGVAELDRLLKKNPNNFYAYRLRWQTLPHLEDEARVETRVEKDMSFLHNVPQAERTEFFYSTYENGLERMGRTIEAKSAHDDQIRSFPKGRAAQNAFLDRAAKEADIKKKVLLYETIAAEFKTSPGTVLQARRESFLAMKSGREEFSQEMLMSAAAAWSESELNFAPESDPSLSYIFAEYDIASTFVGTAPQFSLKHENQAMRYIAEAWPNTDLFDAGETVRFWPLQLQSLLNDNQWQAAKRVGSRLIPHVERGRLTATLPVDRPREVEIRSHYAIALERTGDLNGAFLQRGLVSILEPARNQELADFTGRHKEFDTAMDEKKANWRKILDVELKQRDLLLADDLLKKQTHIAAQPFQLKSLTGASVSLDSFKGKPLVLVFWASWCHYCKQEMDELTTLANTDKDNGFSILAVSVDTDRKAANDFIKGRTLPFTVAFSDGTIDAAYQTEIIPQLFVLDAEGFIRFRISGTDIDFAKSMKLMLEDAAAAQPTGREMELTTR